MAETMAAAVLGMSLFAETRIALLVLLHIKNKATDLKVMADVDNSQSPISQESAYQPISERSMKEWDTGFFDAENARK
ncbi:hypothetical protein D0Y65_033327 [Glycine soja]|uniref:Uncharacterized protein n=1 Tax=Glycine soja TaxID=3848 RepID=A0A445HKI7_GLYSO|nr:hypothetical protein D0Y65_033327 [Glycine soja]